jgi:SnoaL-like domain
MKKISFSIALIFLTAINLFAQSAYTEATLNELNARFKKNPIEFLKNETAQGFVYISSVGISKDLKNTIMIYEIADEPIREFSNVKIYQDGSNAYVEAVLKHTIVVKKTQESRTLSEGVLITLISKNSKWLLQTVQHFVLPVDKITDESAIKKVIEGQTQASYDRNLDKALSYWANVPYASFVLASLNANLTGFEQIKNTYTMFMKANSTPDKSKIETIYKSIQINGNAAFVKEEEVFTDEKGIVSKHNGSRYLEKINNEWKLVGSVVTPMPYIKTDDEAAIKSIIIGETQAYIDGDGKKLVSFWADNKKSVENNSQFLVPIIGQPYAKGESMQKLLDVVVPNLKKQDVSVAREDFEIRINKDMAWATYTQKASANGTVFKTDREARILERIAGEWKLVYVGEQAMK